MRKLLFTIALMIMTLTTLGQTELYNGLSEGMTKDEVKQELKQNDYKGISFGNGVEWQVYSHKTLDYENDGLVGVHMIGSTNYGMDATGKNGQQYLSQTAKILIGKGYKTYLENDNWQYPHLWDYSNYKYGLMLVNPENTKVVHLYYTGTSIMATMTIKTYDQIEKEFKQYRTDQAETIENLDGF